MSIRSQYGKYFLDIYDQFDFVPDHGIGSRMYDIDNFEVIDFAAGIAVNSLGHAHPKLVAALTHQAHKLWHTSNVMVHEPAILLGKTLVEATRFDKVFLCNSGTEAIEAASKLARRYARKKYGEHKNKTVSFENSFHGRSLLAVSTGGQKKYSEDFAPLPNGITHGIFNQVENLADLINENTAIVITEPIQAEGGIIPATLEFMQKLRELCDKFDATLIFDEVQTGVGRTGKLYAYEHYGVVPDIIATAKGLGGGFPIGAILVKEKLKDGFAVGSHGTTFGGNPLAASVAKTAFEIINTPEVLSGVERRHQIFYQRLLEINAELDIYSEIRGVGLLIGAELAPQYHGRAREIIKYGLKHGVAVLNASPNVTRIVPSLIIPEEDIIEGLERFKQALIEFKQYCS
jgi:acetylornithine/N-succinyldiaminopimelate aminotransferase